jgi:hypothetical protein
MPRGISRIRLTLSRSLLDAKPRYPTLPKHEAPVCTVALLSPIETGKMGLAGPEFRRSEIGCYVDFGR